ncbi:MAG: exo-beta-N-acetylmuramidase NamZ domain-containing protein [Verrucomicrobiota bacterium]
MLKTLCCYLSLTITLAAQSAFDPAGLKGMDELIAKAVAKKNPNGAVVWLEHRGQTQTLVKGARALVPVREEMTADTIFDAASLTKVVATLPSVMILADQGKIDIEAPVSRYLKEFVGEGRELICVRHLLTHTSGLKPGIPREPMWTGYADGIRRATSSVPEGPPDSFFRYSDVNFILLGEVVQRVSGKKLDVFAQDMVFKPLKMTSTRFTPPADWRSRIAPTERDELGQMLRGVVHDPTSRRMGGVTGHAGLFTTAADLARYARMILGKGQLDGARVLKAETIQKMQTVQTAPTVFERRGFGWDIDSAYSRPRGEVFPIGSVGHTGFTGTSLWIEPASQSFVIFLSSRLHPDGGGSVRDLYELVGTAAAKCIPGFDFKNVADALPKRDEKEVPTVLNGIDVLQLDGFAALKDLRIGLITNHTGMNVRRENTIDLLHESKDVKLVALFSPEHGIRGELDQEKITDSKDKKTGLPVYSLYGETRSPKPEHLKDLDALVFDIQDIGCRFYTYISTLRLSMEAAAKAGKKFIVLDRVNPITGVQVEGPAVVDEEKFTATHAIPIRHGMTVGELAQMMNTERKIGADLQIIRCEGWKRDLHYDETGLPWQNPSPNMRSPEAALLYPGVGLLEFSISVGRGTETPFQLLGAPYVNDLRLAYELNKLGLPGLRFVPVRFKPTASVFKDESCGGVRLIITDRDAVQPVAAGVAIGVTFQKLYPSSFALSYVGTLLNHAKLLEQIKAGKDWRAITESWAAETAVFEVRRAAVLIY